MSYCEVSLSLVALCLVTLAGCADSSAPAAVSVSLASSSPRANIDPAAVAAQSTLPENVAPANSAAQDPAPAPTPTSIRILDRGFDDIKFEMEKEEPFVREMLTPEIESLVGQPIRIRGYILPTNRAKGLRQFVLVRDNMECCFGPGAALFDCILVEMDSGLTTEFSVRPIAVEGVFDVRELLGPDGKHLAIYYLRASKAG